MNKLKNVFGYIIFMALALVLGVFQTTFWAQYLNFIPEPQFWLIFLVYWGLYRDVYQSLLFSFLICIVLISLTGTALIILFINALFLLLIIWFIKTRLFQPGPLFFMLATGIITLCATPLRFILSWVIEATPQREIFFFSWLLSPLITALVSLPLIFLFKIVDDFTFNEVNSEYGNTFL